jgi:hypothetical protein
MPSLIFISVLFTIAGMNMAFFVRAFVEKTEPSYTFLLLAASMGGLAYAIIRSNIRMHKIPA